MNCVTVEPTPTIPAPIFAPGIKAAILDTRSPVIAPNSNLSAVVKASKPSFWKSDHLTLSVLISLRPLISVVSLPVSLALAPPKCLNEPPI